MASIFFSAAHKSSGKTTVSVGVSAALKERGFTVQPFKKGPDYIDPVWLGMASDKPCYTLDFYTASQRETISDFHSRSYGSDFALVEGNKGLYDGLDLDGSNSNAALAKALKTPVVLVIDCRGMMRGIAPLLLGYQAFDRDVNIVGVIANKTGGARHQSKLRMAIEHYTDIRYLGALARSADLLLPEQHIGLIPAYENSQSTAKINAIKESVNQHIDLDTIIELAHRQEFTPLSREDRSQRFDGIKIGIPRDSAFGFYYPSDLEKFVSMGATLIPFDTLVANELPDIDGLFIGGGFPERHGQALQDNSSLRESIRIAIERGLPVYAECGGLMYLCNTLTWKRRTFDMVGALPGDIIMHDKPQGRGYVQLQENSEMFPWPAYSDATASVPAHEFHFSSIRNVPGNVQFAYDVSRGTGVDGKRDGLIHKNVLASYAHRRDTVSNPWICRFLRFISEQHSNQPITTLSNA